MCLNKYIFVCLLFSLDFVVERFHRQGSFEITIGPEDIGEMFDGSFGVLLGMGGEARRGSRSLFQMTMFRQTMATRRIIMCASFAKQMKS